MLELGTKIANRRHAKQQHVISIFSRESNEK